MNVVCASRSDWGQRQAILTAKTKNGTTMCEYMCGRVSHWNAHTYLLMCICDKVYLQIYANRRRFLYTHTYIRTYIWTCCAYATTFNWRRQEMQITRLVCFSANPQTYSHTHVHTHVQKNTHASIVTVSARIFTRISTRCLKDTWMCVCIHKHEDNSSRCN